MTDTDRELSLQDEDRLPWLEAVEDDEDEGISSSKILGFVLASLVALAVVVGGIWWLRGQERPVPGSADDTLIAAQEGDYKVKPTDPGGMKVDGQGDTSFAASEGAVANGKVDMNAQPEAPVAGQKGIVPPATPAKPVAAGQSATTAIPANAGKIAVKPPVGAAPAAPAAAPVAGGAGLVQLGAFGSEAMANNAWAAMTSKTPQLGSLPKTVAAAAVGGNTVYRLRANAGSAAGASQICAAVKASGGSCMVVR
jgi:hypothetical protein